VSKNISIREATGSPQSQNDLNSAEMRRARYRHGLLISISKPPILRRNRATN